MISGDMRTPPPNASKITAEIMNDRCAAMATLAAAPGAELKRLWDEAGLPTEAQLLRGPETGLVTLRGRIGGGGAPFNFGEATVTRATVRLPDGAVGHAYALGRDKQKARLSAIADALWQQPESRAAVEERLLAPLRAAAVAADEKRRAETAATRVDFFTLVRGED
jgi:alpha-D-ribose 1-methylphosphonate 5-triphosphate synthase subunit PhnG